ncbi:hypothetical protein B0H14DRAFT_2572486 [Mycena olivaceomarginata]|nr:hypothetical protein B0H14DRAFT_2572486 [Mycena olivaceomarginata]
MNGFIVVLREMRHSVQKRADAAEALRQCGKSKTLLREQWKMQYKYLSSRTKTRGQQAVNAVMLLRAAVKTRQGQVHELRQQFLEAVQHDHPDAAMCQAEYLAEPADRLPAASTAGSLGPEMSQWDSQRVVGGSGAKNPM